MRSQRCGFVSYRHCSISKSVRTRGKSHKLPFFLCYLLCSICFPRTLLFLYQTQMFQCPLLVECVLRPFPNLPSLFHLLSPEILSLLSLNFCKLFFWTRFLYECLALYQPLDEHKQHMRLNERYKVVGHWMESIQRQDRVQQNYDV